MKINSKNYLCVDGKKIELTTEQVKQFKIVSESVARLSEDGEIAHIGKYEFIIVKKNDTLGTVELLLKDTLGEDMRFGNTNDFRTSYIKETLEEFADEIAEIVGEENLVEHIVDLTADDGLKCYGTTTARMSLFTANMARGNVELLDKFKINKWWWLVTPYSTPKHNNLSWVKCVSPLGDVNNDKGDYRGSGVRPFCILKSNIFVS